MESPTLPVEPHFSDIHPTMLQSNHDMIMSSGEQREMLNLTVQPLEVLHHILCYVAVQDLASLSATCKHLRDFIAKDDLLWKRHYLNNLDEPRCQPQKWQGALKNLMQMRQLLQSNDIEAKDQSLSHVADTVISLLTESKSRLTPRNQAFLAPLFVSRSNKSAFLSRSTLFRRAGLPNDIPADTPELCQLSAKLHVYYGMEIEPYLSETSAEAMDQAQAVHPCARSRVYDLRRYKATNYWGPFMDDGSGKVDWEKVQSIMIVLARGLKIFSQRVQGGLVGLFWNQPFHGVATNSFTSLSLRDLMSSAHRKKGALDQQDPYGVSGTWMRVVNFLDYHDLFAYNFQPPFIRDDQERPPICTNEAIRLISLKIKATRIEPAGTHYEPGTDFNMPIVHFEGMSRSLTNQFDVNGNSRIRGYVRTTSHGDIRWTTFSIFGGEERWRSESVQIGGLRSARGTIGNWFDRNYDLHGPAGPTAFWKIGDDVDDIESNDTDEEIVDESYDEEDDEDDEDDEAESDDEDQDNEMIEDTVANVESQAIWFGEVDGTDVIITPATNSSD